MERKKQYITVLKGIQKKTMSIISKFIYIKIRVCYYSFVPRNHLHTKCWAVEPGNEAMLQVQEENSG